MKWMWNCPKSVRPKNGWFVGSLFAICFVVPLVAQQTDQGSEYYARGMRAMQLGLYDEAVNAFSKSCN